MDAAFQTRLSRLAALRPARKSFDVLAEQLPIGVYETDAEGRLSTSTSTGPS